MIRMAGTQTIIEMAVQAVKSRCTMIKSDLVLRAQAVTGEGPLWDEERAGLWWVDIPKGEIRFFNPASGEDCLVAAIGQQVGAVVLRRGGALLAAAEHGFFFVEESTGKLTPIYDPESNLTGNRFNDGKCDPAGRFWAGTMDNACIRRGVGALYRLDADMSCHKLVEGVSISNGLAWSPDRTTMYYADTPTGVVDAFDYDDATGEIANRRTVVRIAEGAPDGMTIDRDGNLWVAQWGGWQVSCYDPGTGRKLEEVAVPAAQTASCAFGGEALDTLYITTARNGLTGEAALRQPLAGSLFAVKPGVRGLPAAKFAG